MCRNGGRSLRHKRSQVTLESRKASWNADNSASLVAVLWPRVFCLPFGPASA
jgi:hypothetical protein